MCHNNTRIDAGKPFRYQAKSNNKKGFFITCLKLYASLLLCCYVENVTNERQLYTWQAQWIIPANRIKPVKQRKWTLSRIEKLWKGHKASLKAKYCKPGIPKEALGELSLSEVDDNQFHVFVEYWFSQKGMIVIVTVVQMFFFYRFHA